MTTQQLLDRGAEKQKQSLDSLDRTIQSLEEQKMIGAEIGQR